MKYSKKQAIETAKTFIKEVNKLEQIYGMTFNSDTGDIYLTFKKEKVEPNTNTWDTISLGWDGDGGGIKVIEEIKNREIIKEKELSKLSDEEREILGL